MDSSISKKNKIIAVANIKNKNFKILFKDVNLRFDPGEFIAILGESGSGKTTFLNMISGIDLKTSGKIFFNDKK